MTEKATSGSSASVVASVSACAAQRGGMTRDEKLREPTVVRKRVTVNQQQLRWCILTPSLERVRKARTSLS